MLSHKMSDEDFWYTENGRNALARQTAYNANNIATDNARKIEKLEEEIRKLKDTQDDIFQYLLGKKNFEELAAKMNGVQVEPSEEEGLK